MKRPPAGLAVLTIFLSLLFTSCDQFFSTNLFQKAGLGQQKTPDASTLASMSVSDLQNLADSPSFYGDLADDPAKKAAVLGNLSTAYTSASDPATLQSAAALYAAVQLNTTDGAAVVSGVVGAALTSDPSSLSTGSDIVAFLKASLPADVLADSTGTKFKVAVTAILAAKPAYDVLGASIIGNGGATTLSPAQIGDAAQGALLSYALNATTTGGSSKVDDLWALISGTGSPTVSYTPPNDPYLNAILAAAHSPFTL